MIFIEGDVVGVDEPMLRVFVVETIHNRKHMLSNECIIGININDNLSFLAVLGYCLIFIVESKIPLFLFNYGCLGG